MFERGPTEQHRLEAEIARDRHVERATELDFVTRQQLTAGLLGRICCQASDRADHVLLRRVVVVLVVVVVLIPMLQPTRLLLAAGGIRC